MANKGWINKIVEINESKAGNPYLRFTENADDFNELMLRLKPGSTIMLKDFHDELKNSLDQSRINKETHDRIASSCSFKIFEGDLGPTQD